MQKLLHFQRGIVTHSQVVAAGLSPSAIKRRVASGRWIRLGMGVYATFTGKSIRDAELWTAVLRAGPGTVLSHETAAEVHGFADPNRSGAKIHVTVPAERTPDRDRTMHGVRIHRSRNVAPDWQPPWELPRTTVEDTVLDLITSAKTFDDAYGWICRALGRGLTNPRTLREAIAARRRMRWRKLLVEALTEAMDGIASPLERRYARDVERAHRLPRAKRQAQRRTGSGNRYLDNLYEDYGICVELDGPATHPAEGRWLDTRRDNDNIEDDDTRTLRYGWLDVTTSRCRTAVQIGNVLRRAGWTGCPVPCGPGCVIGPA